MRLTDTDFRYPGDWCRDDGGGSGKGRLVASRARREGGKMIIIMLNEG